MILYHDIPKSKGVENALKRAAQLRDLEWTPVMPCPCGASLRTAEGKQYIDCFHQAWLPLKGVNYSSVRRFEKYVGENVSFETYMTALANPHSVMYTRPQHGVGLRMFSYYGTVCSEYVSYVCDLPLRQPCAYWPHDPHVSLVDHSDLNKLELCDIVLNPKQHIAIITDIERDVDGNVQYITVSECTVPLVRGTRFTTEGFRHYWLEDNYCIYRRDDLDRIEYEPTPYVRLKDDPWLPVPPVNRSLLPDFGNKANYMMCELVELNVLEEGWETVCIEGPETVTLPIVDRKVEFLPQKPGFYTACCVQGENRSETVEFCVTDIDLTLDKEELGRDDQLQVSFRLAAPEDELVGWIVQNTIWQYRGGKLFDETEKGGSFTVTRAAKDPTVTNFEPGAYQLFVLARNKFGTYKSGYADFVVKE